MSVPQSDVLLVLSVPESGDKIDASVTYSSAAVSMNSRTNLMPSSLASYPSRGAFPPNSSGASVLLRADSRPESMNVRRRRSRCSTH